MGFFDSFDRFCKKMDNFLDELDKKTYSKDNLISYFCCEIRNDTYPEIGKTKVTTKIHHQLLADAAKLYPEAHGHISGNFEITHRRIEEVEAGIYKIVCLGKTRARNAYDDFLGDVYFRVVFYADKYAELSANPNHKSGFQTSKTPIEP